MLMAKRIPIATAALLNGDSAGTYRSLISTHLRDIGQKTGRERMVGFAELMLLRVVTEIGSGNLNLKQAATRALALAPYIRDVALGKIGKDNKDVFAVEFWGRVGRTEKRTGFICDGPKDLAECIAGMAEKSWPNMRAINLNRMMGETQIGWLIATEGAEAAKAKTGIGEDGSDLALKVDEFIAGMIDEMAGRLMGRRRAETPANDDWKWWKPPAEAQTSTAA
jgi:hypothetical protein